MITLRRQNSPEPRTEPRTEPRLEPQPTRPRRDRYVDFLRAASLLVVVGWHWVFSIVTWHPGPGTTNPIGTTPGLWAFTWVLQVMPVFFLVGGFAHLVTWESVERSGGGYRQFLARRLKRLLTPAGICLGVVFGAWGLMTLGRIPVPHLNAAVMLLLSPLWFLAIYVGLVLLAPLAVRLQRAAGNWSLVALAAAGILVDVLRFHGHVAHIEWLNMVLVWGFAHQLGFSWRRLVAAPRRLAWALSLTGLAGLAALTMIGSYPRSMVGVPGEAFSNMGPPTACILALTLLQAGVVLLLRERVTAWLERPGPQRFTAWAGARSMTVYLWHFPAFAAAYGLAVLAGLSVPQRASLGWWLQRPLWVVLPALLTYPFLRAFRRFEHR
ncbi:MAG: acyltransferase [Actinomycetota bacterium]|nr:acyltransferase [Actinomycetota bacterium]